MTRWNCSSHGENRLQVEILGLRILKSRGQKVSFCFEIRGEDLDLSCQRGVGSRRVQKNRFITEMTFISAVGRPYHRPPKGFFNCVAGIWPFVNTAIAHGGNKNRLAGNETSRSLVVYGDTWKTFMIIKVFPALRRKCGHAKRSVWSKLTGKRPRLCFDPGCHPRWVYPRWLQHHHREIDNKLPWLQYIVHWVIPLPPKERTYVRAWWVRGGHWDHSGDYIYTIRSAHLGACVALLISHDRCCSQCTGGNDYSLLHSGAEGCKSVESWIFRSLWTSIICAK